MDVLEADDYMDMIIEARTNNGSIQNFPKLIQMRESGNYENTNWQDAIFRNALNYRGTATITGGTEILKIQLLCQLSKRGWYPVKLFLQKSRNKRRI